MCGFFFTQGELTILGFFILILTHSFSIYLFFLKALPTHNSYISVNANLFILRVENQLLCTQFKCFITQPSWHQFVLHFFTFDKVEQGTMCIPCKDIDHKPLSSITRWSFLGSTLCYFPIEALSKVLFFLLMVEVRASFHPP